MKGYKAMNKDWTCRGFKYGIGKTYTIDEEPIMGERGFHFCQNPIDVFGYYPWYDTVIAEIEADGVVLQEGTDFCTNKIRIIREFTRSELSEAIRDEHYNTGYGNSGNYNTGYYNSGNYNSGFFNTNEPTVWLFNHDSGMSFSEFFASAPLELWVDLRTRKLTEEDKKFIKNLPRYDAKVFKECTGIEIEEGEGEK